MTSHDYAAELGDVEDGLRAGVTLVGLALIGSSCEMEPLENPVLLSTLQALPGPKPRRSSTGMTDNPF